MKKFAFVQRGENEIWTTLIVAETFEEALEKGKREKNKMTEYDKRHNNFEVIEFEIDEACEILIKDGIADDKAEAMAEFDVKSGEEIPHFDETVTKFEKI